MTLHTASTASATSMPRSVPPAPLPSAGWEAASIFHLRSASGTTIVSTARSVQCPWWGVASSPSVTTSFALSVEKIFDLVGKVLNI